MKTSKEENAVSPVVGVMLMLVVTIIIAALVSTFAGGLGGETQVTPTAVIGVNDYTLTHYNSSYYKNDGTLEKGDTYDITNMSLKNRGGTTLSTAELSIVFEQGLTQKTYRLADLMDNTFKSWGPGDVIKIHRNAGKPTYGITGQSISDGTPIKWKILYTPSGESISSGSVVISNTNAKIIDTSKDPIPEPAGGTGGE